MSVVEIDAHGVEVVPVAATRADEYLGCFSPDGAWISYVSNESGRDEFYVLSASGDDVRRQVSCAILARSDGQFR